MQAPEPDEMLPAQALRLMRGFFRIRDAEDRRALIELAERFACSSVEKDGSPISSSSTVLSAKSASDESSR
jgi:hypothetical protein